MWHPALIKINKECVNAGIMCTFLASNGRPSIINSHVWVDHIMLPLDRKIKMGHVDSLIFSSSAIAKGESDTRISGTGHVVVSQKAHASGVMIFLLLRAVLSALARRKYMRVQKDMNSG